MAEMWEIIQVELSSQNEDRFIGSLTMLEAKHGIYRDCLGFSDFSNFDGVSIAYKGRLCITFKLKQPINVDNLYDQRYFEFNRKSKQKGKIITTMYNGVIKGLRSPGRRRMDSNNENMEQDDSLKIYIKGCEFQIAEEKIKLGLSYWGDVLSEISEETFHDPHDKEGTNRTGTYSVTIRLSKPIPQWIPMGGK